LILTLIVAVNTTLYIEINFLFLMILIFAKPEVCIFTHWLIRFQLWDAMDYSLTNLSILTWHYVKEKVSYSTASMMGFIFVDYHIKVAATRFAHV